MATSRSRSTRSLRTRSRLELIKRRYGFSRSYTEKHARRMVVGSTTGPTLAASAKVSGTVATKRRITGTISVTATGCNLKSSQYNAKFSQTLPS